MTILENLKKAFEGKFRDILSNNNITFFNFSRNTNEVVEVKDGNKLVIDLSKATIGEKILVKNILDSIVQSENEAFLMDHSSEKTLKVKISAASCGAFRGIFTLENGFHCRAVGF